MKKIWKKSLLTLGGIVAVTTPVVAVVSCSDTMASKEKDVANKYSISVFKTLNDDKSYTYHEIRAFQIYEGGGAITVVIEKAEYDLRGGK